MATQWYYAHGADRLGPFSQQQLKEMAAAGIILPIDTVWLHGNEQGVQANLVKNLFPHLAGAVAPIPPAPEILVTEPTTAPPEGKEAPKAKAPEKVAKKGRAVALKGADIVGQDGAYARFRKKCITCGQKDTACHSITIANKTVKQIYFCPKCRKAREVVIQCNL